MFLETDRLLLRPFRDGDFEDYFAYASDRETARMEGTRDLSDRSAALANFHFLKDREARCYAIVRKADGRMIGHLIIQGLPPFLVERDMPELRGKHGVCLSFVLSPRYRRQGLMSEALQAVIDHLFLVEGLDYIQCGYFDFNLPSRALQEKLGFTFLTTGSTVRDGEEIHTVENILWRNQAAG